MTYSLKDYYQINISTEKQYLKGQRLPTGVIIKTKDSEYYLVGDVAPSPSDNTIPDWGSAGCGCCSRIWIEPSEIVAYIDILGLET